MKYIDLHCDTLMNAFLSHKPTVTQAEGMVDIKRLREGGAMAQFFAMFLLPPGFEKFAPEAPKVTDEEYIAALHQILMDTIEENRDVLAFATNADQLMENDKNGKLSAFLTIEDGRSVDGKLENIQRYYDMGVRLISLTWNFENCFGAPNSTDPALMAKGLTPFGKEAVPYMQELGMLVDVSHLSDGGFWDVVALCKKPFVASHSNLRSLSPHQRNLQEDMLQALAQHGGVAGINFGPEFLNADVTRTESTVALMSAHIRRMIDLGGIGCPAIGSDFDGIHGQMEIPDAAHMQLLFDQLHKDGLTDDQIEQVAWKNAERVIREAMN